MADEIKCVKALEIETLKINQLQLFKEVEELKNVNKMIHDLAMSIEKQGYELINMNRINQETIKKLEKIDQKVDAVDKTVNDMQLIGSGKWDKFLDKLFYMVITAIGTLILNGILGG